MNFEKGCRRSSAAAYIAMVIHTVKNGDTVFKIARQYKTSPMKIIENNGLTAPDRLVVGQQLLILFPTRTYIVRGGDTLEQIARRFGVNKRTLHAANPYLAGTDAIYPGELLAIRYDAPQGGVGAVNGYVYTGCDTEQLIARLPYLTYVTLSCAVSNGDGIRLLFDDAPYLEAVRAAQKTPMLRLLMQDAVDGFYTDKEKQSAWLDRLIALARERGYSGITLALYEMARTHPSEYVALVMEARCRMLGCDLILFTETDADAQTNAGELADGDILVCDPMADGGDVSFADGERALYERFANQYESSKTFIDFPAFGYDNGEPIEYDEIMNIADKFKAVIEHDESNKLSRLRYQKFFGGQKEDRVILFSSPEHEKAKLDLVDEFGFMGICVDVMRTPIAVYMMMYTLFSEVNYPFVLRDGS